MGGLVGVYYLRLIYDYLHLQSSEGHCSVVKEVVHQVISLPVHPNLKEEEVKEVAIGGVNLLMRETK